MADELTDNVRIQPPEVNNQTVEVRTEVIDKVHYPLYKQASGSAGAEVSVSNPIYVAVANPYKNLLALEMQETNEDILKELRTLNAYMALMTNEEDPPNDANSIS